MVKNIIEVGPWGGSGGANPFSIIPVDGRITQINIRSGAVIDAISFRYTEIGSSYETPVFGGPNGSPSKIDIADDEEIINIIGKVGDFEGLIVVTQLTFVTNKGTYGPYGRNGGTDFSLPITKGKVIGFFGRYSDYLYAIGAVLSP